LKSLRNFLKTTYDRVNNDRLRRGILQVLPFWVASLITGLVAVAYTRLFAWAEKGTSQILSYGSAWIFLLAPVCFLLAWWIVKSFAPYAGGSGIPQVMASIDLINAGSAAPVKNMLGLRIILVKIVSSLVMVFGGGAIGREGPTIQISGSIFARIHSWLPDWWPKISRANMIISGAAAGLAAAFNTPLGGIVFAVEELARTHIRFFRTAIFTAVIIAGLTAQGFLGPYLYLGYPVVSGGSLSVFFVVLLVAMVCGLAGSGLAHIIVAVVNWKRGLRSVWENVLFVFCCAVVISLIAYFFTSDVLGSGKNLMTQTLFTDEKHIPVESSLARILGPLFSFTTGASGGIFAPSLSAGAGIGSVLAGWLNLSALDSNLIILTGMVGFLTGVTRSPFTSAILVLEMTDRHNVIFHLMFAAMVSHLAAFLISRHSLYDRLKKNYIRALREEIKT
jgi:H+/Cl- antiporter ClcA